MSIFHKFYKAGELLILQNSKRDISSSSFKFLRATVLSFTFKSRFKASSIPDKTLSNTSFCARVFAFCDLGYQVKY